MTQTSKDFPHIYKAALEMAYDNGGINRYRTEEQHRADLDELLGSDGYDRTDLEQIDVFLTTLSENELQTFVAGEQEDMEAIADRSPIARKAHDLMNAIFEEVC